MAGDAVFQSGLPTYNIGIVNFDKNSANGQQREAGFCDRVKQDAHATIIETINVKSTIEDAKNDTIQLLEDHPEINVIVTFNEWTSLGVGYAIQEMGVKDRVFVIAFDSNIVSVGMLETGEVDALIVQNPYAMGYLGVEAANNLINDQTVQSQVDTATTLVTKDNMFDEECQRALFSFDY